MDSLCVYCAGPLFNQSERDEMTAIAEVLVSQGHSVFLPHRDGMEFRLVREALIEQGWAPEIAGSFLHEAIFALDVYQLAIACDAMVWNLNGRVPDEGAVSEATPIDHDRLPVKLKTTVDRGAELWKALQKEKAEGENKIIADCVTKLFGPSSNKETR